MKRHDKSQNNQSNQRARVGVLLIHSLGGSPIELRYVAQALTRSGYLVHCPLLKGLAGGTDVSGFSTWRDWYAGVEQAFEDLKENCDIALVGGISAGAMLALRLAALKGDDISGIVLFSPTLWPNGWSIPWYFNLFRVVRSKWVARLFHFKARAPHGIKDERIRAFVTDSMNGENGPIEDLFGRGGGLVFEFERLVANLRPLFGQIRQQTLIFHPRTDDQSDLSNTITLQRRLAGRVDVCVLDDSYHMVTLDKQRTIVADRTLEFVDRLTKGVEEAEGVSRIVKGAAE